MDIKRLIGEATEYDKKEMLEYKKPKSWLKSVSAFANGMGGADFVGSPDLETIFETNDSAFAHAKEIIRRVSSAKTF